MTQHCSHCPKNVETGSTGRFSGRRHFRPSMMIWAGSPGSAQGKERTGVPLWPAPACCSMCKHAQTCMLTHTNTIFKMSKEGTVIQSLTIGFHSTKNVPSWPKRDTTQMSVKRWLLTRDASLWWNTPLRENYWEHTVYDSCAEWRSDLGYQIPWFHFPFSQHQNSWTVGLAWWSQEGGGEPDCREQ